MENLYEAQKWYSHVLSHMWGEKGHEYGDRQAFAVERPGSFRDEIKELEKLV